MASTEDFAEYIVDQIGLPHITYKKMFGEYAVYLDKKVVAFICNNTLFVKIFPENELMADELERGPAYPGSKDYFIIDEAHLEDRIWLQQFIELTAENVPQAKPKKKSRKDKKGS